MDQSNEIECQRILNTYIVSLLVIVWQITAASPESNSTSFPPLPQLALVLTTVHDSAPLSGRSQALNTCFQRAAHTMIVGHILATDDSLFQILQTYQTLNQIPSHQGVAVSL